MGQYPGIMDIDGPAVSDEATIEGEPAVESAILGYLRQVYEDPAIITGWVVVAEFVDRHGEMELHAFAASGMPYWKINGMLDAGPAAMNYSDDDDED